VLERVVQLTPEAQSCSVGVATWNGEESSGELIARVDEALYEGKKHKHADERRIYVARSSAGASSSGAWADRIPRLVENGDIVSVYQPIVNLGSMTVVAYEAFPRTTDDPSSESDAGMFESAKRMGYLRDLEWICRRAALEGGANDSRQVPLFVKMSVAMLVDPLHEVDQLLLLARAAERSPGQIVIEIAEQEETTELGQLITAVTSYRGAGFRFAIDQFGGGHSTLEVLVAVNPEFIKIAGSLTVAAESPASLAAIQAIITFAQAQGATVVAQGVDSDWQLTSLRELGVSLGQGDLLGQPAHQMRDAPVPQHTTEAAESARRIPRQRPLPGVS
jgi:EAL domain-containing protein (putative c-di-GMP-specific phosphodiesterase class I)